MWIGYIWLIPILLNKVSISTDTHQAYQIVASPFSEMYYLNFIMINLYTDSQLSSRSLNLQ